MRATYVVMFVNANNDSVSTKLLYAGESPFDSREALWEKVNYLYSIGFKSEWINDTECEIKYRLYNENGYEYYIVEHKKYQ